MRVHRKAESLLDAADVPSAATGEGVKVDKNHYRPFYISPGASTWLVANLMKYYT